MAKKKVKAVKPVKAWGIQNADGTLMGWSSPELWYARGYKNPGEKVIRVEIRPLSPTKGRK